MTRAFDWLLSALALLLGAILVTGGTWIELPTLHAKIDLSSANFWVALLLIGLWIRQRLGRNEMERVPSPAENQLDRLIRYFADPVRGPQRSAILFGASVALMVIAHLVRHWSWNTQVLDHTVVLQALAHPWGIRSMPVLRSDICPGGSYLGTHLAFNFFLVAPLGWLPDEFFFLLQGLIAGGVLILSLRATLGTRANAPLWFWALLPILGSIAFRSGMIWDFREDVIAFAAMLGACTALSRQRFWTFGALVALAMLSKENIPFVTLLLAVPAWAATRELPGKKKWLVPIGVAVASAIYGYLALRVLMPHFMGNAGKNSELANRFSAYGSNPSEILKSLLFSPRAWINLLSEQIFRKSAIRYVLLLIWPFAVLWHPSSWRRIWPWLVPALPGMAMNLLSNKETQVSLFYHYEWIILPFLIFATWQALLAHSPNRNPQLRLKPVYLALLVILFSGRWPGASIQRWWPTPEQWTLTQQMKELIRQVDAPTVILSDAAGIFSSHVPSERIFPPSRSEEAQASIPPATQALLDGRNADEKQLSDTLLAKGWKKTESSPFLLLNAPSH